MAGGRAHENGAKLVCCCNMQLRGKGRQICDVCKTFLTPEYSNLLMFNKADSMAFIKHASAHVLLLCSS